MDERDRKALEKVIEHAEAALWHAGRVPDWRSDQTVIDAIVLRVGQIGERVMQQRLSQAGQEAVPDVPWSEVRMMRSHIYHEYDLLDLDILADTLENGLPDLVEKIKAALDEADSNA